MLFELYVDTYIIYVRYIHTYTNIIWGSLKSEAFRTQDPRLVLRFLVAAARAQGNGLVS